MAETTILQDLDTLVAPIPGPDPQGADLWRAEIKDTFDEARKESVRFEDGATAYSRPIIESPGNWGLIIRESQEYLTSKTKDLFVTVRLIEALAKHRDGNRRYQPLQGLSEGLLLLRRLVDEAWDRLYPAIDDGDLEVRASPISWLDDHERANSFPHTLRCIPLVGDFWYFDFNPSALSDGANVGGETEERRKAANLAAVAAGATHWEPIAAWLQASIAEVAKLDDILLERMGEDLAPSVSHLRRALQDLLDIAQSYRPGSTAPPRDAAAGEQPADAGNLPETSSPREAAAPQNLIATRADIYARLAEAAAKLQEIEPHSPIPYLLQRAVELGHMPFPKLMRALISDNDVLNDLDRGLGIKYEESDGS
jgi:type VI secretion system protein ImpA